MTRRTGRPKTGRPRVYTKPFEDYISPEPNSGCWLWDGGGRCGRRALVRVGKNRVQLVHKFAWERYRGPIPPGLCVCHHCDVPLCVNPDHLFLGTQIDNMADRQQKGRQAKGEKIGMSKLLPEQVLAIRSSAESMNAMAQRYSVSPQTIGDIRLRKTWMHL